MGVAGAGPGSRTWRDRNVGLRVHSFFRPLHPASRLFEQGNLTFFYWKLLVVRLGFVAAFEEGSTSLGSGWSPGTVANLLYGAMLYSGDLLYRVVMKTQCKTPAVSGTP